MDSNTVKAYYSREKVIRHYEDATRDVGLWISEEKVFKKVFKKKDSIIDLGTGAGRIAIGLYELGYYNMIGVDFSRLMIKAARRLAKLLGYGIPFSVADIRQLPFADDTFEGAIFGFNGLMHIPMRKSREDVLKKIFTLLKPDGFFVFTTHNRNLPKYKNFWEKESDKWALHQQHPDLEIYGDIFYKDRNMDKACYIHVPDIPEMTDSLKQNGFRIEVCVPRSKLAQEPREVSNFSEECLFWIAQKPKKKAV